MIKTKEDMKTITQLDDKGRIISALTNLANFENKNPKLRTFSLVKLGVGEEVYFHVHENEFESYYIISGKALYTDNDKQMEIFPGTVTFTPSGEGHAIKNIGEELLEFITLIILD